MLPWSDGLDNSDTVRLVYAPLQRMLHYPRTLHYTGVRDMSLIETRFSTETPFRYINIAWLSRIWRENGKWLIKFRKICNISSQTL